MLYYNGTPVDTAVYCASNGGASEDAGNVWNADIPYLRGKQDPYEALTNIPNYNWSVTYTADELDMDIGAKGIFHWHSEECLCGGIHPAWKCQQGNV